MAKALSGIEILVIGLVLAIGSVGVLLTSLVGGLATVMVHQGLPQSTASALAALIVGAVIGGVAWALISRGLAVLRGANFRLDRSTASLRRDVDVVKEKM